LDGLTLEVNGNHDQDEEDAQSVQDGKSVGFAAAAEEKKME